MVQITCFQDEHGLTTLFQTPRSLLVATATQTDKGVPVMARVELHTQAPPFSLPDFQGRTISLADYAGRKNVLVVFNRGFI